MLLTLTEADLTGQAVRFVVGNGSGPTIRSTCVFTCSKMRYLEYEDWTKLRYLYEDVYSLNHRLTDTKEANKNMRVGPTKCV
jgi:hypothetical protein